MKGDVLEFRVSINHGISRLQTLILHQVDGHSFNVPFTLVCESSVFRGIIASGLAHGRHNLDLSSLNLSNVSVYGVRLLFTYLLPK
jgi:hypothetical protein